jgi:hypothetical protein
LYFNGIYSVAIEEMQLKILLELLVECFDCPTTMVNLGTDQNYVD